MLEILLEFLKGTASKVSKPARNIVFVLLALAYIYLALLPQFIDGECYFIGNDGIKKPLRGQDIQLNIKGRAFKFKANEDGLWSIPLISKWPLKAMELIFVNDDNHHQKVIIDFWPLFFKNNISIIYKEESNEYTLASQLSQAKLLASFEAISNRDFDYLRISSPEIITQIDTTNIERRIRNIIVKQLDVDASNVILNTNFRRDLRASRLDLIEIVLAIENEFQVQITDEEWERMDSMRDIIRYLSRRA